jgi:hypothetical protein
MPAMSLREYARYRGCTLRAVQKAIAAHRIELVNTEQRGSRVYSFVESDAADAAWRERTDPGRQGTATRAEVAAAGKAAKKSPSAEPGHEKTPVGGVSKASVGKFGEAYSEGRAVRESFAAKMASLEYGEKVGKLVSVDKVKVAFFNVANGVQSNMLAIPARIAVQIAAKYQDAVAAILARVPAEPPGPADAQPATAPAAPAAPAITREEAAALLRAVADEKIIADIMDAEIKIALRQLADGKISF